MRTATGTWVDGQYLRSVPAMLEFDDGGIVHLRRGDVSASYSVAALRISTQLSNVPRFIYFPCGGVFETGDDLTVNECLQTGRTQRISTLINSLERHSGVATFATALLAVIVVVTIHFGLPFLARRVANQTPSGVEDEIGKLAVATLRQQLPDSRLPYWQQKRVEMQLGRLLPVSDLASTPRIEFRSTSGGFANAFALPGGVILVTDEFVEIADADEIAAVLAHEIGHLKHRHGIQTLVSHSFALLVVTSMTGDLSTLTTFAGSVPFVILQNGYSRDLEREADAEGQAIMKAKGIPLSAFTSILRKLEANQPKLGRSVAYLSTHPATEERTKLFGEPKPVEASKAATPSETPAKPVVRGTSQPCVISQRHPEYPMSMRVKGVSGTVKIQFIVDVNGDVQDPFVLESTDRGFEAAALLAVSEWKFIPGYKDSQPVNTRMIVPMQFDLTKDDIVAPAQPSRTEPPKAPAE